MKKNIALLFSTAFLLFSCSSDSESSDNSPESNGIIGTWVLTDLRIDSSTNNSNLNFAKEALDAFNALDCDIASFTFNADNTATSENKTNYIASNINVGIGGLTVDCPEESDTETTIWSLDGDQLTFVNEDMEEETITITLEDENTLIIAGEDIDENNYDGADAVFTKQ
nr:lipocalin family protein [uncultured Allomuricauda sp.]